MTYIKLYILDLSLKNKVGTGEGMDKKIIGVVNETVEKLSLIAALLIELEIAAFWH